MSDNDKYFEKLLKARRIELEKANKLAEQSLDAVQLDQTSVGRVSRIDAIQRQEMAKAGEQRRLNEICRIQAAMKRVAQGEYGDCLKCGEEIAEKRLEFDPAAPLCISCAKGR